MIPDCMLDKIRHADLLRQDELLRQMYEAKEELRAERWPRLNWQTR